MQRMILGPLGQGQGEKGTIFFADRLILGPLGQRQLGRRHKNRRNGHELFEDWLRSIRSRSCRESDFFFRQSEFRSIRSMSIEDKT